MIAIPKRFWEKVDVKEDHECWEWQAATTNVGYGLFWHPDQYNEYAHRFSYIAHNGDLTDGRIVCHTCDNRKCVNPNHLYAGTHSDNVQDTNNRGRRNDPLGEDSIHAKLTKDQVLSIIADTRSQKVIATEYGITQGHVSRLKTGKSWSSYLDSHTA